MTPHEKKKILKLFSIPFELNWTNEEELKSADSSGELFIIKKSIIEGEEDTPIQISLIKYSRYFLVLLKNFYDRRPLNETFSNELEAETLFEKLVSAVKKYSKEKKS